MLKRNLSQNTESVLTYLNKFLMHLKETEEKHKLLCLTVLDGTFTINELFLIEKKILFRIKCYKLFIFKTK